jgi:hypothetical protein
MPLRVRRIDNTLEQLETGNLKLRWGATYVRVVGVLGFGGLGVWGLLKCVNAKIGIGASFV